jgi:hypothetical protein
MIDIILILAALETLAGGAALLGLLTEAISLAGA